MSSIADILNAQAGSYGQQTSSSPTAGMMGKDDFLKLLVTQLSNQDPLSPMKNEEFVAQLAQFSSLEQLVSVNEGLETLALGQMSQSSASAVGFIGKSVRAMGGWADYDGETPADMGFELAGDAEQVTLTITDEDGDVVRTEKLGPHEKGAQQWTWDGKNEDGSPMEAGAYTLAVAAETAEGQKVEAFAVVTGRITGISYENGYPELLLGDHKLALADVIEVLEE